MRALLTVLKSDDLAGIEAMEHLDVNTVFPQRCIGLHPMLTKGAPLIAAAAFLGSAKVFRFLMANDASLTFSDHCGRNIALFAAAGGNSEIMGLLNNTSVDWTVTDLEGNTSVHYALMFNRVDAVYWLWSNAGLDVNILNKRYMSPLHIAAISGDENIINFLVTNGCDVNQKNDRGLTPLHMAAQKSDIGIVNQLIDCGADLTIRDNNGCLPYQWASFQHIQCLLIASAPV